MYKRQELIFTCTRKIYQQFYGYGGCTLVAAWILGNQLHFWSVGDSDLFLLREHQLYALNTRQEFQKDLLLRSFHGAFPIEEAFSDPQAGALSQYIGKEEVTPDRTYIPLSLFPGDVLLLCSDGISDPLTLKQIREAMELPVQDCCSALDVYKRQGSDSPVMEAWLIIASPSATTPSNGMTLPTWITIWSPGTTDAESTRIS